MGWGVRDYPTPPPEPPIPTCPVCGQECDVIYVDIYDTAVGCDMCIEAKDSYYWRDENE